MQYMQSRSYTYDTRLLPIIDSTCTLLYTRTVAVCKQKRTPQSDTESKLQNRRGRDTAKPCSDLRESCGRLRSISQAEATKRDEHSCATTRSRCGAQTQRRHLARFRKAALGAGCSPSTPPRAHESSQATAAATASSSPAERRGLVAIA